MPADKTVISVNTRGYLSIHKPAGSTYIPLLQKALF